MSQFPTNIPVSVITGFLGSGKTTLLSALLKQEVMTNTAVIINEFGEVGIDHNLIETTDENIVELQNGCICCTIQEDLKSTLLDLIKKLGLEKNTLIMFNSDNGAHGKAGTLDFFKPSGNLKGIKRTMYEGGLRSPMVAYWPGKINAGTKNDHLSAFWDMLPTFSELTGEPIVGNSDGISMLPTLLGKNLFQKKHEYLYWELYEGRPNSAVRYGKWKGVVRDRREGNEIQLLEILELKIGISFPGIPE